VQVQVLKMISYTMYIYSYILIQSPYRSGGSKRGFHCLPAWYDWL